MNEHVRLIVYAVAECYGMHPDEILSNNKEKSAAEARLVAMYLARVATGRSYPELARDFGKKDHSTPMSAVKRVPIRMVWDERMRAAVESVTAALKPKAVA